MSKARDWGRGETLDFINDTGEALEASTVMVFGERIGIVGADTPPGEKGVLHVTGAFWIPKTAAGGIEMGVPVYFDGEGITDDGTGADTESDAGAESAAGTEGDGDADTESGTIVLVGYAAQTAAADDSEVLVKLLG